jgi:levansucrase
VLEKRYLFCNRLLFALDALSTLISRFLQGQIVLDSKSNFTSMSAWTADQAAKIGATVLREIPVVTTADIVDVLPQFQLWDCWSVDDVNGISVAFNGWVPWVVMCAPRNIHPDLRHNVARLRLMMRRGNHWRDCGFLLPDELNPGSREWAGSTVFDANSGRVTLFYTATGRKGQTGHSYEQRLFQASGILNVCADTITVSNWSDPVENVVSDGVDYVVVDQKQGRPGFIKGFRDPFHFRDPVDGADYLLFTASLKPSHHAHNGVIGIARSDDGHFAEWQLLPPLLSADGVNNELERPVLRHADGRYYLFWSTQRKTFSPDGPAGPNGLYGMVAESLFGPYYPLNGSGLVAPNPASEPYQTYSWWVDHALQVTGFVDLWGLKGKDPDSDPDLTAAHFGGVPAPTFRLALKGDHAHIIEE